ncbi:MAG: hypothetical protein H6553_03620 [Chitinophagales bacterium]|nr:hypothetical protein [Chitinophagales bacterium]
MKKTLFSFITILLIFSACKQETAIEYKKTVDVKFSNLQKNNPKINGIMLFHNISENELTVKDLILTLRIDGKPIGTIKEKEYKAVKPNTEFSIPFKYNFEKNEIVAENQVPADVYLVELEGDLTMIAKDGKEFVIPIQYKEAIDYHDKQAEKDEKKASKKEMKKAKKELKKAEKEAAQSANEE